MLWSSGGDAGDGFIVNYDADTPAGKTEYARRLPYLSELVEQSFDLRHLTFARLAVISDSVIIPHKDLLEYGKLLHRVHVPLITNDACFFSEGNVVYRMRFGEVWFFDAARMHSAASFSEQERVHLMLDFEDVEDPLRVLNFRHEGAGDIPPESVRPRGAMTDADRESLMSLASVINIDNYRDVFSIVIKKHYVKDGGEEFIWDTFMQIADASHDPQVAAKARDLRQYFLVKRSGAT